MRVQEEAALGRGSGACPAVGGASHCNPAVLLSLSSGMLPFQGTHSGSGQDLSARGSSPCWGAPRSFEAVGAACPAETPTTGPGNSYFFPVSDQAEPVCRHSPSP